MDWYKYIVVLFVTFLLSSCGQVGRITGGPVDNAAPVPVVDEITPPLASLNVAPNKIEIPFNEYIALNKPAENIRVSPNDVSLAYSIQGRSLVLEVDEGKWKENTTYSIYLNRAVKDITEANDSIMLYVFSTGPTIDSLQGSVEVKNAYDGKLLSDITVGLYNVELSSDTVDQDPLYFGVTDKQGIATFQYLKEGEYFVYAFKDENKNNQLDPAENRGKLQRFFTPFPFDTLLGSLDLMPPAPTTVQVRSNEFKSPGLWCLGFNMPLTKDYEVSLLTDGFVDSTWNQTRDSITFFLENSMNGSASLLISKERQKDTISKRFFFKDPVKFETSSNLNGDKLKYNEPLILKTNDALSAVDRSKIILKYLSDSTELVVNPEVEIRHSNELAFRHLDRSKNNVKLILLPESIIAENLVQKDTIVLSFAVGKAEELGTLNLTMDTIPNNGLLFLTNSKGQTIDKRNVSAETVRFEGLDPGRYSYYILLDENSNGVWDTGNIFTNTPPEKIIWLNQTSTVRANWEVESKLTIKSMFD